MTRKPNWRQSGSRTRLPLAPGFMVSPRVLKRLGAPTPWLLAWLGVGHKTCKLTIRTGAWLDGRARCHRAREEVKVRYAPGYSQAEDPAGKSQRVLGTLRVHWRNVGTGTV